MDNIDLACQLFNTLSVGIFFSYGEEYDKKIKEIEKDCTLEGAEYPDRQKILLKIIELAGNPDTPKQRYIIAKAYAWSRVEYRDKAIYYLKLYLSGPLCEEIYENISHDILSPIQYHLNDMFSYLGKAYISKYDFENALKVYEFLIKNAPNNASAYMGKCEVLIKQNKLQECLDWLVELKSLPYYELNEKNGITPNKNWFNFTVDRLIKDVENKIQKNYVYKPRKPSVPNDE